MTKKRRRYVIPKKPASESSKPTKELAPLEPAEKRHLPIVSGPKGEPDLPAMECSTCAIGAECPEYKEGYICAWNQKFNSFGSRDTSEIQNALYEVVGENMRRLRFAWVLEKVAGGGMQDPNVTHLSNTVVQQLQMLHEFDRSTQSVRLTATGKGASGILSKMFGVGGSKSIDLNPAPVVEQASGDVVVVEMTKTEGGKT
jgi:hypothetical protein